MYDLIDSLILCGLIDKIFIGNLFSLLISFFDDYVLLYIIELWWRVLLLIISIY